MNVAEKCPFCLWAIAPGDPTVVCVHCGVQFHTECWDSNDAGCVTPGCAGLAAPESLAPAVVAGEPEPVAHPARNFCDQCGARVSPQDRFCGSCGTRLEGS
ncbi:MAG TPA: zinc ribbon domain-containing protein [Acidimicrobiia bacterium]|nr:zinc ribbon domain-containing protein [Acidimicrobiia bacterium]